MDILFGRFFWFAAALITLLNYFIVKRNKKACTMDDNNKSNCFLYSPGFFVLFGVISVLLGVIQLVGGFNSPLYSFSSDYKNPYVILSWIILLSFIYISFHLTVFGNKYFVSSIREKLFIFAILVIAIGMFVFGVILGNFDGIPDFVKR